MAERVQRTCIKLTAVRTPARGGGARLRSAGLRGRWEGSGKEHPLDTIHRSRRLITVASAPGLAQTGVIVHDAVGTLPPIFGTVQAQARLLVPLGRKKNCEWVVVKRSKLGGTHGVRASEEQGGHVFDPTRTNLWYRIYLLAHGQAGQVSFARVPQAFILNANRFAEEISASSFRNFYIHSQIQDKLRKRVPNRALRCTEPFETT